MLIPIAVALAGLLVTNDSTAGSPGSTAPEIGIAIDLSHARVLRFGPEPRLGLTVRPYAGAPARRDPLPRCAARIVSADPRVDPQIAVRAPRDVDLGMAVSGRCEVEPTPAPARWPR